MGYMLRSFLLLIVLIVLMLLGIGAICYEEMIKPEPEIEVSDKSRFIPGGWTPELIQIYNNSDPINSLEYSPFRGVLINGEFEYIDELVILMIPEGVENRASFVFETQVYTWENENVLIGNNTMSSETELIKAYVFVDINVSNALYNRHEEINHPTISYKDIEVRGVDLTLTPFYNVEVN